MDIKGFSFGSVQLESEDVCDEVIYDFVPCSFASNGYPPHSCFYGFEKDFDKICKSLHSSGQIEKWNILRLLVWRARRGENLLRLEECFLGWPYVSTALLRFRRVFCFIDFEISVLSGGKMISLYAESVKVEQAIIQSNNYLDCVIRPTFSNIRIRYDEVSEWDDISYLSCPVHGLFSFSHDVLQYRLFQNGWDEEYIPVESFEQLCDESADASKMDFGSVIHDLLWALNI